MAEQPDGAGIVDYWNDRGVPFEAIEALAAGFASSSVRSIGRAARDREQVEAVVKTAMKVGLAGGWELRDRAAFAQAFGDQGNPESEPDVAVTTPAEAAILEFEAAAHSKGYALSTEAFAEFARNSGLLTERQATEALQSLVERGLLSPDEAGFFRLSEDGEKWARYWRALSDA